MDYMYEKESGNVDWGALNFKTYGADNYEEKLPGFNEDLYKILAYSTKDENKVIDTRPPPLKINHEVSDLKFDWFGICLLTLLVLFVL